MTTVIKVNGMMCSHCKARVEQACLSVPGVQSAVADLSEKNVAVCGQAEPAAVCQAIRDAGFEAVE